MAYATHCSSALAASITWINLGEGLFGTSGNWGGGVVPTSNDISIIGNSGTAIILSTGSVPLPRLRVGSDGSGTVLITGGGTAVSNGPSTLSFIGVTGRTAQQKGNGALLIDGFSTLQVSGTWGVRIGTGTNALGASGSLVVRRGSSYVHDTLGGADLYVGLSGGLGGLYEGSIDIDGGSVLVSSVELEVGTGIGSGTARGVITIRNGGGLSVNNWTKFGGRPVVTATAGGGGYGVLNLMSGTFLKSGTGYLIFGDTAGEAEVNQSGGLLDVEKGELVIGGYKNTGVGVYRLTSGTLSVAASAGVGRYGGSGALIMTGGAVIKTGSGNFEVGSGWSTSINAESVGNGSLLMTGGRLDVREGDLVISAGVGAGSSGTMTVSGAAALVQAPKIVISKASSADGVIRLSEGRIESLSSVLAASPGSTGRASVGGGEWAGGEFVVGDGGIGFLEQSGGNISATDCFLGRELDSEGHILVAGGTLTTQANLTVGLSGTGTLSISGGLVTVGGTLSKGPYGSINLNAGATLQIGTGGSAGDLHASLVNNGTLIFDRAGSSKYSGTISGSGNVVKRGNGDLTFTGTVVNTNAVVFDQPLHVEDGELYVADAGLGVLRMGSAGQAGSLYLRGGRVSNVDGWLGAEAGGAGVATVTGGTWSNSRYLDVGAIGTGTLLLHGGLVTGSVASIAWQAGSTGVAVVTGGTWSNLADMRLGDAGNGTLRIEGGKVTNGGDLSVGRYGTASLLLSSGTLTDNRTRIGYYKTGTGTVDVSGGEWINNDFFYVGVFGKGRLGLSGGLIRNTYAIAGYDPGADGEIEVSGGNLIGSDFLVIGRKGTARMNLIDGYVGNTDGVIGYYAEGSGTVLIGGGTWANSGNLKVGGEGGATLTMAGGLVTVGGTLSKGAYGTINLQSGGVLQIGTGEASGVLATDLVNAGTLVFNRAGSSSYTGVVSGSGRVDVNGSGTLTFSNSNAYSGGTLISNGVVRAELGSSLGSGPITLAGNAKRLVLGDGAVLGNDIVIDYPSGQIGNGVIQYEGAGTARLVAKSIQIVRNVPVGGEFATLGSGTLFVDAPIVTSSNAIVVMRRGDAVFSGGGKYSVFRIGEGFARIGKTNGLATGSLIEFGNSRDSFFDLNGFDQTVLGLVSREGNKYAATVGNQSVDRDSILTIAGTSTFSGVIQDGIDGGSRRTLLYVNGGWLGLTGANTMSGSTTIKNGVLYLGRENALSESAITVLAGGTLAVAPEIKASVAGLRVSPGGTVEVGNGMITVSDGLSPLNLYAAIIAGRGNGNWDAAYGVRSEAAAISNGSRTVGWLDNGDGSVTFGYAAAGDTNLDWRVDVLDVANFISSGRFNTGLSATWAEGDFNYDGYADILDMGDFISSGLFNAGSYNIPTGTIAAVPEPSTIGLLGVGAGVAGLVAARRKRAA